MKNSIGASIYFTKAFLPPEQSFSEELRKESTHNEEEVKISGSSEKTVLTFGIL